MWPHDSVLLGLMRDWNYNDHMQLGLKVMDLCNAPMMANRDENSRDPTFFTYIQRMQRISKPSFSDPFVWMWIHTYDVRAKLLADFVKWNIPKDESMHSVYHSSKNKCLNNAKTCAPPTAMYLMFLLKQQDATIVSLGKCEVGVHCPKCPPLLLKGWEVQQDQVSCVLKQVAYGILHGAHEIAL